MAKRFMSWTDLMAVNDAGKPNPSKMLAKAYCSLRGKHDHLMMAANDLGNSVFHGIDKFI